MQKFIDVVRNRDDGIVTVTMRVEGTLANITAIFSIAKDALDVQYFEEIGPALQHNELKAHICRTLMEQNEVSKVWGFLETGVELLEADL